MNRKVFSFLIVLFILSACQPSPGGQGQAATARQIAPSTPVPSPTKTFVIKATPTPEVTYKINPDFPSVSMEKFAQDYELISANYDSINLEDFTSGKLMKYIVEHTEQHPLFTDDVQNKELFVNFSQNGLGNRLYFIDFFSGSPLTENPNTRMTEVISLFEFKDDELLKRLGIDPIANAKITKMGSKYNYWPIWAIVWAQRNPSKEITYGLSLTNIMPLIYTIDSLSKNGKDFRPVPYYKFENMNQGEAEIKKNNDFFAYALWQSYPDLEPDDKVVESWIKSGEMPEELQKDIFALLWMPHEW